MLVEKLHEHGYEEAALGFSLSYNSTIERSKEILPKYAFGIPGENKFLESITVWLDITAPRFFWQEFDTYRVGISKMSQSTIHTLLKEKISLSLFDHISDEMYEVWASEMLDILDNPMLTTTEKKIRAKEILPESFLQRRVVTTNYKTLQNMYNQRKKHTLPHWREFCKFLLENLDHPEFIDKEYGRECFI